VSPELIRRCYEESLVKGNAIPAITAVDSIRIQNHESNYIIDRENVRIIQTPQTFQSSIIKAAFQQEYLEHFTDEASVVETTGMKINLVDGEADNIKITRRIDMLIAEKLLEERELGV
jgi:2-C-methyl-D-erythritol 4-phosphate cytidylyltransferase